MAGLRQRTGTLLAAHALVASFLAATTVRARGLDLLGWIARLALVLRLVVAAILLASWRLKFSVDWLAALAIAEDAGTLARR